MDATGMDMKIMAANTAIADMLAKGYLCICTIKKIVEMLETCPDGEAMSLLSTLHCVNFDKMPKELYAAMPELISRAIGNPRITCVIGASNLKAITEEGTTKGWLGFGRGGKS